MNAVSNVLKKSFLPLFGLLLTLLVIQQVRGVRTGSGALASLRYLMSGGDVLSPEHVRRTLQASSSMLFINGYGPTECTVFTSTHTMSNASEVADPVSIGKPIANTEVCLLDQHMQLVPLGASGEICIGGDGAGRGYFNRRDLTADRWIPNPFSSEPGVPQMTSWMDPVPSAPRGRGSG